MKRRKFLQHSVTIITILSAVISGRVAGCDPHPATIRVVDSSDRSPTTSVVSLLAGQTVTRRYTLYNGGPTGARLLVKIQPRLQSAAGKAAPLPAITRDVTVPANGQKVVSVDLALPKVSVNTLMELMVRVTQDGKERDKKTGSLLLVPPGIGGTQAIFLDRDDRTKGNWQGSYGKQAFTLPIRTGTASFAAGTVSIYRGLTAEQMAYSIAHPTHSDFETVAHLQGAFEVFDKAQTVNDPRIPPGGNGLTTRDPIAFTTQPHNETDPKSHISRVLTTPVLVQVDSKDNQPHRLSLYFVDYKRAGMALKITLYDRQGHSLVSQRLADYGEGAYLRFRFVGSLVVLITSLAQENPTLSGAFVDPDTGGGLLTSVVGK
jgi:hypothetical protein